MATTIDHQRTVAEHIADQNHLHTTALERRATGLQNWVMDFPAGPGRITEWEQQQLSGMLPYTDTTVAMQRFAAMSDQVLIMANHSRRAPEYKAAQAQFEQLVRDAIAADESAAGR